MRLGCRLPCIYIGFCATGTLRNVQVEVIDPRALKPRICSPVLETDPIFSLWDEVCEKIIQASDLIEWSSLECYRFGQEDETRNPPTVIISVDPRSRSDWDPVRDSIVGLLNEYRLFDVAMAVIRDVIVRNVDRQDDDCMPLKAWKLARAGVSVGLSSPQIGSGTLGGFLELQEFDGTWKPFGITFFHVVYPGEFALLGKGGRNNKGMAIFHPFNPSFFLLMNMC